MDSYIVAAILVLIAILGLGYLRRGLKHRKYTGRFDIRNVLQRGTVCLTLLALITCVYLGGIFTISAFVGRASQLAAITSGGITAVIGIFTMPRIRKFFYRLTDRIFFKDSYDYASAIRELSEILNRNMDREEIVAKTSSKLKAVLKIDDLDFDLTYVPNNTPYHKQYPITTANFRKILGAMLAPSGVIVHSQVPDDENINEEVRKDVATVQQVARELDIEVTVLIALDDKILGIMRLGPKLSGDVYTNEDLHLLKTFSYQLASALDKAELFDRVKRHSLELESRVRERTAELQQAYEDKKRMMVDIAHGLQTPLTVVRGEIDILKRQLPNKENIRICERSIDDISKLTYNMLSYAQLATGREDSPRRPVDLSAALNEIVEYFGVLAENQGVSVECDIEPDIAILGDRKRLEEMVTNMLSNALKYMRGPKKSVAIRLAKDGNNAKLTVRDTGIGIDKNDLPHIFERFYRAANNADRTVKGTGLGLAISKRIAEMHGGSIEVESEPRKGTMFTVSLPIPSAEPTHAENGVRVA